MFSTATKEDAIALKNSPNLREATQNLKETANDAKDDLRAAANQAGRKVRNLFNTASNEISHASETVTSEIRTNPVRSSVIALGVGVILGALLRR